MKRHIPTEGEARRDAEAMALTIAMLWDNGQRGEACWLAWRRARLVRLLSMRAARGGE